MPLMKTASNKSRATSVKRRKLRVWNKHIGKMFAVVKNGGFSEIEVD